MKNIKKANPTKTSIYEMGAKVLRNPRICTWFVEVLHGNSPKTNISPEILDNMIDLDFIKKTKKGICVGSEGIKFALKLELISASFIPKIVPLKKIKKYKIIKGRDSFQKVEKKDSARIKKAKRIDTRDKKPFYPYIKQLDELKKKPEPTSQDRDSLFAIINKDRDLTLDFYRENNNEKWLSLLRQVEAFKLLGGKDDQIDAIQNVQAKYLSEMAKKTPQEVFDIFDGIKLHEYFIKDFIQALLNMPLEIAVKGVSKVLDYLKDKDRGGWYFKGYNAAQLMVKLAETHPNEAFAIADEMLKVWVPESKRTTTRDIESKFKTHEYKKFVFEFFNKLCGIDAFKSTEMLITTLKGYIDEIQKGKDYEVEMHWYIRYERLDQIGEKYDRDILACIIGGICEAGKSVIKTQTEKIDELFKSLKEIDRQIFRRIEMYLLRFALPKTQTERINEIISNKEYRTTTGYKYEYYLLFNDRFDDISDDAKKEFLEWIKEKQVPDDDIDNFADWFKKVKGRDYKQEDLLKYEDSLRARKLSLIKERFKEEYEEYRNSSGLSDTELAPKPRTSKGRWVDPAEGAALSVEEMVKMKPEEVVAYIVDEEKWKDAGPTSFFNTPEEALISAFGKAIQQKVDDYIKLGAGDLLRLKPEFLTYYFDGLWTGLREKEAGSESWKNILEIAITIVNTNITREDYERCFGAILSLVAEKLSEIFKFKHLELIWGIIEPLTKYQYNPDAIVKDGVEEDPYQECTNCVQGKAFELAIRFGIECKKEHSGYYEKTLSKQLIEVLDFIANRIELPKVVCVFGVWLIQLHWIEKDWFKKDLDLILSEEDIKKWDAVWGSYVTWGRAAPEAFGLLVERGKYQKAIGRIGEQNLFEYEKDPEEGLTEHLMIGFFNSWIDFDNELLKSFFAKALVELRGYAARFLTTGFKNVKEDKEYDAAKRGEIAKRLKLYWESRLDEISKAPKDNIEETQEFANWVKDSLLSHEDTLNLLHKTLELSEGKIGENVYSVEFVEGISDAAKGNEIKALQCLKLAFNDDEMRTYSQCYDEKLNPFIDSIINLPDGYPDIENIRKEAIRLIDTIGRICPDLREVYGEFYNRLSKKIPAEEGQKES